MNQEWDQKKFDLESSLRPEEGLRPGQDRGQKRVKSESRKTSKEGQSRVKSENKKRVQSKSRP